MVGSPATMAEEPGKQSDPVICEGDVLCDRYRADRVIAHGGTGTVLAVTDLVRRERAAIKMISADHAEGELLLARLRREGDILARLTSPHVVRVLDVAMHGRTLCLVMELLEGSDMARFVRKRGPLPIEEAVGYIVQACDGLADAHQAGVVHRDVKPQNVFLAARSDGTSIVKVLDFGVSKQYSVSTGAGLTVSGTLLGSPPYSSPEQLRDPSSVDGRADIWSMGLVLYFLLTRRNAFDAETFPALLVKIASQEPPPLREQRSDVPEELESIVLRCIQKDPAHRFPDMASLARALAPFAPAWSEAFIPAIDIRAAGRGSLVSLPVIPLRPDVPEENTPIGTVPSSARLADPAPKPASPSTAGEGPASAPDKIEEKQPAAARKQSTSPRKQTTSPREKLPTSPVVKQTTAAAVKNATTAAVKKAFVPEIRRARPDASPPPAPRAPAPARESGALKVLTIALVAVLSPALVGLVLFLVSQFGGCGSP